MNASPYKQSLSLGISISILSYLFFAASGALVKIVNHGFPTIEIVFFQNLFSLICIIPYCLHHRKKTPSNLKSNLWIHLIRDLSGFISYLLYFYAIKATNLVDATVLAYTTPFFTPLIWWIWTKQKAPSKIWFTIILGFVGIALILKPGSGLLHKGAIFALLAGIFSAVSLVSIRILNNRMESLSKTLFFLFLMGTLFPIPMLIPVWQTPNLEQLVFLFSIGLFLAIGQILLTIAYRHGTAAYLSPICYMMVIFMTIISWKFFDHTPDLASAAGAIIIVFGGSLTYLIKRRPRSAAEAFQHPPPQRSWRLKLRHPFKHYFES